MAAPRKKWATRLHPAEKRKTHTSQTAAYRHIRDLAALYANGSLRADLNRVSVWVDEGHGRGWELYETVNLADLASKEN